MAAGTWVSGSRRLLRVVGEVRPQPLFGVGDVHATPTSVVLDLVAADAADGEVAGLGVREQEAADAGGGRHRVRAGQAHAEVLRSEQPEQFPLQAVIR